MKHTQIIALFLLVSTLFVTLACASRNATPTPNPIQAEQTAIAQAVAAERTIAQAVAATLTAESTATAIGDAAETTQATTQATATATKLVINESVPATAPPASTAMPTRLIITESDIDGNQGNNFLRGSSQRNDGRVALLPSVRPYELTDPMIFNDRMALRVEVFDTRVGVEDGDGIRSVTFAIVDDFDGKPVYTNTEEQTPFCLFGGNEPLCTLYVFALNGLRWPNGEPIYNDSYTAQIDIVAQNGDETQWRWGFQVQGATNRPGNESGNGNGRNNTADFSGMWQTNFADVTLQQRGTTVTGSYVWYGSNRQRALNGEVDGRTLTGHFGNDRADRIVFTLNNDGDTFDGSWLYRTDGREHDWCGIRVGLGALPDGCGFSGEWLTASDYTSASQPTARLQQVGPKVSGTFFNGSGSGTIIGNLGERGPAPHHSVSGIYTINGSNGAIRWDLLDFNSDQFSGCWVNQQGAHEWCGWRPGGSQPGGSQPGGSQPAQCLLTAGCP